MHVHVFVLEATGGGNGQGGGCGFTGCWFWGVEAGVEVMGQGCGVRALGGKKGRPGATYTFFVFLVGVRRVVGGNPCPWRSGTLGFSSRRSEVRLRACAGLSRRIFPEPPRNSGRGIRPGHEERSLITAIDASKQAGSLVR
jgi:hypothetical protein